MKRMFFATTALVTTLLACGCGDTAEKKGPHSNSGSPASPAKGPVEYRVKGVVREVKPESRTVVVKHEKIPNYMEAMTMPFEVKEKGELAGLLPGDVITFRMWVTDTDAWIDQVRKVDFAPAEIPSRESVRVARVVDPLAVGDALPNYTFTNQLGKKFELRDFKGKALALTFIFTRCPYPTFCPRMSQQFTEAQRRLLSDPAAPHNWQFLSISFDTEADTPEVLKTYAERYQPDPRHWFFATGALIDIDALTEQFGLVFSRDPQNQLNFNHTLRTAVIDATGKVQKVFVGNTWTVDELLAELKKAASAG